MYYVILTARDDRLSSFAEVVDGEINRLTFDDFSDYRVVLVDELDVDLTNDLADYRYDDDLKRLVYDPMEEPVEYLDLETGEVAQVTSADIDALVDEKVRNQVEAVLAEMAEDGKLGLMMPGGEVV